jgi:5-methylcytosine-specific restriction enzyme A
MTMNPCIDCTTPATSTRCPACQHAHQARKTARRPARTSSPARATNAQLVTEWVQQHGERCPGLPTGPAAHPPHPTGDLTADHIHPIALGGPEDGPRRVLCRAANSRLGALLAAQLRAERHHI